MVNCHYGNKNTHANVNAQPWTTYNATVLSRLRSWILQVDDWNGEERKGKQVSEDKGWGHGAQPSLREN